MGRKEVPSLFAGDVAAMVTVLPEARAEKSNVTEGGVRRCNRRLGGESFAFHRGFFCLDATAWVALWEYFARLSAGYGDERASRLRSPGAQEDTSHGGH